MKGIGVSPGIAIGKAFVIQKKEPSFIGILLTTPVEKVADTIRFDAAIKRAIHEVEQLKSTLSLSEEDSAILDSQIELLNDPEIRGNVIDKIEAQDKNANDALLEVIAGFVEVFESMDDDYMRARAADIKDIGNRILKNLNQSAENKQTTFVICWLIDSLSGLTTSRPVAPSSIMASPFFISINAEPQPTTAGIPLAFAIIAA